MSEYKVPQIPFNCWFDREDPDGFYMKYAQADYGIQGDSGVRCLTIRRNDDGTKWMLRLYRTSRPAEEPLRTIDLGSVEEIPYSNEAVLKAIELASAENGITEKSDWMVKVYVRNTITHLVEANSKLEAIAQVSILYEDDIDEALANGSLDMPEYMLDDAIATKLR